MEFATRAIHVGQEPEETTGAVIPPIYPTTIYAFEEPGVSRAGYEYIRYGNPTRHALEVCLASLEEAPIECPALCFSSGMAAIDAAFRLLRPNDRLLLARDVYGGTTHLAETILRPNGVTIEYADASNTELFIEAITPDTCMVWLETPANPLLQLTDIAAVVQAAHDVGALVAVDNTFATPYLQNPLALGADIVMHSSTKYLGGHSDTLGGALVLRDPALRARLWEIQKVTGAVASPFDCWLTLRGIRTLAVRMRTHCENALRIAQFLMGHPRVRTVYYPGLTDPNQRSLVQKQMRGMGGGMVSVELEVADAEKLLKSTTLFTLAGSLGGVESIISYPAKMSHAALPAEERRARGIGDGLVRLSVGLENVEDLIADLEQALG
ncbi:MAG TPA: PLP-dependent aspartate aminotransferase family protein [Chthonomonas sp.]|jgi:cystathionine gamma-lyase|uniref:trans-sulfuration enzyme family protein n=1 Tax=Chthonomonas sp. TaxID=2282153 RepID=UPI002B4B184D|nr:PLP-dependent aspartate aminotransferase family protein [Chthonomonas sp.]HLH81589.1 PLP-dependent aspartate aminotransferase family protein [Chthonomonas sp.]